MIGLANLSVDPTKAVSSAGRLSVDIGSMGGVDNASGIRIDQSIPGTTNRVVTGTTTVISGVDLTRPANTIPYDPLDVVCDSTATAHVLTFAGMGRVAGASGLILRARIVTDQVANTGLFRLHLFHTSPAAIVDNAFYTLLYTDRAKVVDTLNLGPLATEGTGSSGADFSAAIQIPYLCDILDTQLYGVLETVDGFTPASGQKFFIELTTLPD